MDSTELLLNLIELNASINRQLSGPLSLQGIGLSEYLVLNHLHQAKDGRMRRVDLATHVGLTPSGITRLLNPMEKIGLVEKEANPRDARVSLAVLTKAGEQIYQDASQGFKQCAEQVLRHLGEQDQHQLGQILKLIL